MNDSRETPRGDAAGFVKYFRHDVMSGLLVFLIALPLCLAISLASGYPPLAGIFTAVIGSILTTLVSNSELTIKGPAAGLIVIALGCITEFRSIAESAGTPATDSAAAAYRMALAVGVVAAIGQVLLGLFRGGALSEFFPLSAVHGMLAAIGVIIIAKQIPVALGVVAKGEPIELLKRIPEFLREANPAIALIGVTSLAIMFLWPQFRSKVKALSAIPAALVVLVVAVPMGMGFDLLHKHSYVLQNHKYQLSDQYLVTMPKHMFGMFQEIAHPDFAALSHAAAWKWAFMFFMIGSLETLLSAKAIDLIDPWRRKTNMNRDLTAVGAANLCSAMVGGLPMISEIVRSKANIDNGARTRFADLWHGVFLLLCVALIPGILHLIPLAALAAMLIYTGYRLAHPTEFVNVYKIGREQLAIFVTTIVAVLATDLLEGILIGMAVEIAFLLFNRVPASAFFKPRVAAESYNDSTTLLSVQDAAVFSSWLPLRKQLEAEGLAKGRNVILNLADTKFVDHTVMDKLHEVERDFEQAGLSLDVVGLDSHEPVAEHARSARRRSPAGYRRLTILADATAERRIEDELVKLGAQGYAAAMCRAAYANQAVRDQQVRIEVVVPRHVSELMLARLREISTADRPVVATVEAVGLHRFPGLTPSTSA
jgi:MFS superfamily sulfate permease-like transporter